MDILAQKILDVIKENDGLQIDDLAEKVNVSEQEIFFHLHTDLWNSCVKDGLNVRLRNKPFEKKNNRSADPIIKVKPKSKDVLFVDTEVNPLSKKLIDIGAIDEKNYSFHGNDRLKFKEFASGYSFVCGHNFIRHDYNYLKNCFEEKIFIADTLYLAGLFFPGKESLRLSKDYKLRQIELSNPITDAEHSRDLFYDEVIAFDKLSSNLKRIFYLLLKEENGFCGLFKYLDYSTNGDAELLIKSEFKGRICENKDLKAFITDFPIELAYALAFVDQEDQILLLSKWISVNYPETERIIRELRSIPCEEGCEYCDKAFSIKQKLKLYFGYDDFRKYEGESLQEQAVNTAVKGESLLAIFPTGGGKSLTFQLPALISSETDNGLTIVISPLQALMKDQIDNLKKNNLEKAVTINGLLSPLERHDAIKRVENGTANLLYISPEGLRNNTIQRVISKRMISRFIIDEAHCFSAWGQDFRVDYQYIGKFIREKSSERQLSYSIPVSCFTATASNKVIDDIKSYFNEQLGLELKTLRASSDRKNLDYEVRNARQTEKYEKLRALLNIYDCPVIVYVFSVKESHDIARRLEQDGVSALPFNGRMSPDQKKKHQEAFINNEVRVIVATSAFGMGIDKDDVGLVVHYKTPASLEDYIQESGRAGRSETMNAHCIALFDEKDIEDQFHYLNQSKLTIKDIQSVWSGIKKLSGQNSIKRSIICESLRDLAEASGWLDNDERKSNTEILTAVGALESAGYVERLNNVFSVYATGIIPKNMDDAGKIIRESAIMNEKQKLLAKLVMETLFTQQYIGRNETRVIAVDTQELADVLSVEHRKIIDIIELLREEKILEDSQDLKAIGFNEKGIKKVKQDKEQLKKLEEFMIYEGLSFENEIVNYKEINQKIDLNSHSIKVTPKLIRAIINNWAMDRYVITRKTNSKYCEELEYFVSRKTLIEDFRKRITITDFIVDYLYRRFAERKNEERGYVTFSLLELKEEFEIENAMSEDLRIVSYDDLKKALLYIHKMDLLKMEGGFFVLHQKIRIKRLERNNRIKYKADDYKKLKEHYMQKIRQIHLISYYAQIMCKDREKGRKYAIDYFLMSDDDFEKKYLSKDQRKAIKMNISPREYARLFGGLSKVQKEIIDDNDSKYITVVAGPGSGKTMVLVHKLASLIRLGDVKCEELLALTFSRMASIQFQERLVKMIGPAAYGVEIKTFHSYCFDILGKMGNLEDSEKIIVDAVTMIRNGEIDRGRTNKAALVIDEAQDISHDEYNLVLALIEQNEEMKVVMVGDDDQNIFEFRGSSSKYMADFLKSNDGVQYNMTENYRSSDNIVKFANRYAKTINGRLKAEDGISVNNEEGKTVLVKHRSKYMELPLVEMIKEKLQNNEGETICILARNNKEAFSVMGALLQAGIKADLIQSNDGFKLDAIAEIRRFKEIVMQDPVPKISEDIWESAIEMMSEEYHGSNILQTCIDILNCFEKANPQKYKSDFIEYINEINYEDFYNGKNDTVTVSTIHKAKGREYDNVYMMLDNCSIETEEEKRVLYVGCTRAKKNLFILYNNDTLDQFLDVATEFIVDNKMYNKPDKMLLHMSFRDIYLDSFINNQDVIKEIRCGNRLEINGNKIYVEHEGKKAYIGNISERGMTNIKKAIGQSGASITAKARFVVYWKKKDTEKEYLVVLPTIMISRFRNN